MAEIRGLARRRPPEVAPYTGVRWHLADLGEPASEAEIAEFLDGVDAVVHLAWALQPGRRPDDLHRVNVEGTLRVARAAAAAGVRQFVHMSSIGAYAAGAVGQRVAEDWPTTGIPSAQYSRDKSAAEREVRDVLARHPEITLTVVRPTLVLQPSAGSEIGRYFLGPLLFGAARLLPGAVARLLPAARCRAWRVAFVHADDVADALVRMLDRRAPGPFNLAAEPLLDADALARALGTVRVPVPALAAPDGAAGGVRRARRAHRAGVARHRHAGAGPRHHPRPEAAGLVAGPPQRRGARPVRRGARPRRGRTGPAAPPGRRSRPWTRPATRRTRRTDRGRTQPRLVQAPTSRPVGAKTSAARVGAQRHEQPLRLGQRRAAGRPRAAIRAVAVVRRPSVAPISAVASSGTPELHRPPVGAPSASRSARRGPPRATARASTWSSRVATTPPCTSPGGPSCGLPRVTPAGGAAVGGARWPPSAAPPGCPARRPGCTSARRSPGRRPPRCRAGRGSPPAARAASSPGGRGRGASSSSGDLGADGGVDQAPAARAPSSPTAAPATSARLSHGACRPRAAARRR